MKVILLYNEDELFQYLTDLVNGMNLGNFLLILVVYDKGMLNYRIPKVSFRLLSVSSEGLLEFLLSALLWILLQA